ncbi:septal ring lytic transglycosylase RlpA family protein [Mesorhizobium sp. M1A.F.Ca.ET.072.01.1.1]|uniref:septal ring lytic transglycosylase RlpA family protein n=1 Tax=Mesorhizobium sp. M1A.F.Ca.ET.072.01.1.1 TaxID=2496753 RepID=UPI000FD27CE7|nr:septal ring lytic transglycosylase RlpA family protein [Mesorhizobium sp. M1A.F.Ca.ET.072.01.1.1]RUW53580.1 septal ring lytic transglycosylase RlpA family protein [Mesorhizobium sp. M1A.F.Ca.ET.072.01.1.1]
MQTSARPRLRRAPAFVLCALSVALLAGCTSTPQPKGMVDKRPRSKEYFAESEYGVKASPRVAFMRGGGRDQLGKPYQVRGKWYYPKEDKRYAKVGLASWYGDAFHGRLTANGEVYDTMQLTAAHPTMPLPSYARVTNLETGSSIIVRVNDRGPYHEGRIIDVSERAAQMLDYGKVGTARVKVEYVGRAPLDGNDDQYLMASYRPGSSRPDPSDGLPTGVMEAMNGPSPSLSMSDAPPAAVPFPGQLTSSGQAFATQSGLSEQPAAQPAMSGQAQGASEVVLPDFGPIVPERPQFRLPPNSPFAMASLSYADERVNSADVFAALDGSGMSPADILQSWKKSNGQEQTPASDYVAAGSFDNAAQANRVAAALEPFGRTEIQRTELDGNDWYAVNVYPDGHGSIDDLLQAAWSHGAPDALVVRN